MKQWNCHVCSIESILDTLPEENDHREWFTGMHPETPNTIVWKKKNSGRKL